MDTESQTLAKVVIRIDQDDGTVIVETPWAEDLGNDLYRLDNTPFYAYSLSWKDIVFAPYSDEEERPLFERVEEKSGHRTIRIKFDPPVAEGNASQSLLDELVEIGCSYEGANPAYIAVDIPPDVEFWSVREFLVERDVLFEHADPSYRELFPDAI